MTGFKIRAAILIASGFLAFCRCGRRRTRSGCYALRPEAD